MIFPECSAEGLTKRESKSDDRSAFCDKDPPIPVIVATLRPRASPKLTTVLCFATRTPPILVIVDTFDMRRPRSDDRSAFCDQDPPDPCDSCHF